jgi:sulfonate transport system ATP-binding protein
MASTTGAARTTRRRRGGRLFPAPRTSRHSAIAEGYAPRLMAAGEFMPPGRPTPGVVVNLFGLSRSVGDSVLLEDVGLVVFRGEVLAVLCEADTGDALARAIVGLDPGHGGRVVIKGTAVVLELATGPMPRLTLADNIALGRPGAQGPEIGKLLAAVGLKGRGGDWPASLNQNELTRLAIAKALIAEPSVLVLNRPFERAGIPPEEFEELLLELQRDRAFAMIVISGDPADAARFADRAVIFDGPRLARQMVLPYRASRSDDPESASRLTARLAASGPEA